MAIGHGIGDEVWSEVVFENVSCALGCRSLIACLPSMQGIGTLDSNS